LELRNLEWLAAADVGAGELVIAANHVGLGLGEAGAVAFVGVARQLGPLAPDYPAYLVLAGLAAFGTGKSVFPHFSCFVEEFTFFHWIRPLGRATPPAKLNSGGAQILIPPKNYRAGAFASLQSLPYSSLP